MFKTVEAKNSKCLQSQEFHLESYWWTKPYLKILKMFAKCVVLLLVGTSAYIFDLAKKELKLNRIIPIRYKHVLCPYRGLKNIDSIYWCYWDQESKLTKSTLDDKFTFMCDTLPTVKRNDAYSISRLIFITADNNAIVADAHKKKFWIIDFGNSYTEINCTTIFHGYIVIILGL